MADEKILNEAEDDDIMVTLDMDDGTQVDCEILTIFEANHRDYIALLPLNPDGSENEEGTVYLYRYAEDEEGMPQIDMIADEGEYSLAAKRFDELLDEEGYFETEEE